MSTTALTKTSKSGSQKRRLKIKKELEKAGGQRDQKKLCFGKEDTSSSSCFLGDANPGNPSCNIETPVSGADIVGVPTATTSHSAVHHSADEREPNDDIMVRGSQTLLLPGTHAQTTVEVLVHPADTEQIDVLDSETGLFTVSKANNDCNLQSHYELEVTTTQNCSFSWPNTREGRLILCSGQPNQPTKNIPFSADIYFQITDNDHQDERIQRKWLTFHVPDQKLFCMVCGCYCSKRSTDLVQGLGDFRRASQIVKRHEESQLHRDASDGYFRDLHRKDILSLVPQMSESSNRLSNRKVERNRQILDRVIDIIKLIASQGLAYRGHSEAARDLLDPNKRHGNFLEIVLMLAKYDSLLNSHVERCVEYSAKQDTSRGRGSFVSFLSKTSVNNILLILCELIQESIVTTINEKCNKKYGVMMDGTVDVSGTDQMDIIVRYVTSDGTVHERLLGLEVITSGKGEDLWNLLSAKLVRHGLSIADLIGLSLDGASANTSQDVGVVKHYHDNVSFGNFVWGFAHQQNLVVSPVFSEVRETRNLMGLLQETCTFFNESSRRMDIWKRWTKEECFGQERLKKLVKVGNTRWSSSFNAIFRVCDKPESYVILLGSLWELGTSKNSSAKTRSQSDALLCRWLKFDSLLTAIVLRDILRKCDPVTKYLQTRGLDIIHAVGLVENELSTLSDERSKFEEHLKRAHDFREQVQCLVDNHRNPEFDVTLEISLPTAPATRKKRRMFDELAADEVIADPVDSYRVKAYLPIVDRLCTEISSRFNERSSVLYQELWLLNPQNYAKIAKLAEADVTKFSLKRLAEMSGVDEEELKEELLHFIGVHQQLFQTTPIPIVDQDIDEAAEDEVDLLEYQYVNPPMCNGKCTSCLGCVLKMLVEYRYHCKTYHNMYTCIRTLLTLPCTVVSCERTFSKLKFVKNRLRSLLRQELLEAMLVCSIESDILKAIPNERVYEKLSAKSSEMQKLLMY